MKKIDLNVDIGEGFPYDRDLLAFATSANICCGEHAGSWELTKKTVQLCLESGVRIGMHPGYPDRVNMGRQTICEDQIKEFDASIQLQVERFFFFVPAAYLKPHGALYNDATGHSPFASQVRAMVSRACSRFSLPLMALPNTPLAGVAAATGVELIREGFGDRAYRADGTLAPRSQPGAVLNRPEEIRRQVLELTPLVESLCLHGDTPGCVEFAELVYVTLVDAGCEVGH